MVGMEYSPNDLESPGEYRRGESTQEISVIRRRDGNQLKGHAQNFMPNITVEVGYLLFFCKIVVQVSVWPAHTFNCPIFAADDRRYSSTNIRPRARSLRTGKHASARQRGRTLAVGRGAHCRTARKPTRIPDEPPVPPRRAGGENSPGHASRCPRTGQLRAGPPGDRTPETTGGNQTHHQTAALERYGRLGVVRRSFKTMFAFSAFNFYF
jgi:hypothetical protein